MGLSARQLAEALDVSHTAVNNAAASGRIKRGPDGSFDLEEAKADWEANANRRQQSAALSGVSIVDEDPESAQQVLKVGVDDEEAESGLRSNEIQRLIDLERLERQRRDNRVASGQLLNRDDTLRAFTQIGRIYGGVRESLPAQLATRLIGKTDIDEIEKIISDALREADLRICTEVESRLLLPPTSDVPPSNSNGNVLVN